jgi:ATP-dependent protease ClpP protease subunit
VARQIFEVNMSKCLGFAPLPNAIDDLTVIAADAGLWFQGQFVPADMHIAQRGDDLVVAFSAADESWLITNPNDLVATPLERASNGLLVIDGLTLRPAGFDDPTCWRADVSHRHLDGERRSWWAHVVVPPRVRPLTVANQGRPHGKGKPLELAIIGEIGHNGRYRGIAEQIQDAGDHSILLTIDSPGGDANEGLGIYRALARHKHRVEVEIVGQACSAACIIALAGDTRHIAPDGRMMLHQVHLSSYNGATAEDLRAHADRMEAINRNLAAIVHHAAKCGLAQARAWVDGETYFDAGRAITAGLAHGLIRDTPAATPSQPRARFAAIAGPYRSVRPATALAPLYGHGVRYKPGQQVRHQGRVYVATRNTFGAPTLTPDHNTMDWDEVRHA